MQTSKSREIDLAESELLIMKNVIDLILYRLLNPLHVQKKRFLVIRVRNSEGFALDNDTQ